MFTALGGNARLANFRARTFRNSPVPPLRVACAILCLLPTATSVWAAEPSAENQREEANPLIVELSLDKDPLADVLTVYEVRNELLLPVGELSSLLTIGITLDPAGRVASGFIVDPDQLFHLDHDQLEIRYQGKTVKLEPWQVQIIDGDIYLARSVLQQAWPVDFSLDLSTLRMEVKARVKLPIQLKLERERGARVLNRGSPTAPWLYPRMPNRYALLSFPFVDLTLASEARKNGGDINLSSSLSASFSNDLMGFEATGFFNIQSDEGKPRTRLTLGRHDPDGVLLGPLKARTLELGDVNLPAVRSVLGGAGGGAGVLISNRPLDLGNSYGLQTLRGFLAPGWDVTLYINDALVAFQTSRADGTYEFRDLNLNYGRTDFRLVFNGPLGERRVENQAFQLDQTLTPPGDLFYTFGGKRDSSGIFRYVGQVDVGVMRNAAFTGSMVAIDDPQTADKKYYLAAGLRAALSGALFNADYIRDLKGGHSLELGVRTAVLGMAVDAARTWVDNFSPNLLSAQNSAPKLQDRLLLNGSIELFDTIRLPVALDARREVLTGGLQTKSVQQRVSLDVLQTNFTNQLGWESRPGSDQLDGILQAERRIAGAGVSGQIGYRVMPAFRVANLAFNFNKMLGNSDRFNASVIHTFGQSSSTFSAGLNRRFGNFSLGLSGFYSTRRNFGLGITLFTAVGRDPTTQRLIRDWQPIAGTSFIAARAFLDTNSNSRFDPGEEPVPGVRFSVNGTTRSESVTGAGGSVLLGRVPARSFANVTIDSATLEDIQWQPGIPGVAVLPRPGHPVSVDLPVVLTSEIDGIVMFADGSQNRGIGNANIELVDQNGTTVATTKSASDGYFVLTGIRPGAFYLRVSPEQLSRLGLYPEGETRITIASDGPAVSNATITLRKQP